MIRFFFVREVGRGSDVLERSLDIAEVKRIAVADTVCD